MLHRFSHAFTNVWLIIILAAMFLGSDGPFTRFQTSAWKAIVSDTIHGVIALAILLTLYFRNKRKPT